METTRNTLWIWVGTGFAALFGLAFGSFLNVCLTRLPEGESIAHPGSHCRNCDHALAWWENLPVLSWLLLGGRCRSCRAGIGWRYPTVELAVAALWAALCFHSLAKQGPFDTEAPFWAMHLLVSGIGLATFSWLLLALAVLDAEYLWLPDALTLPGIGVGLAWSTLRELFRYHFDTPARPFAILLGAATSALAAAALILIIRLAYWLIRRREGMGLGDAKLMAMLGAWLGLRGAFASFVIAIFVGAAAALLPLLLRAIVAKTQRWATLKLPFGSFLCIAAILLQFFGAWIDRWIDRYYFVYLHG